MYCYLFYISCSLAFKISLQSLSTSLFHNFPQNLDAQNKQRLHTQTFSFLFLFVCGYLNPHSSLLSVESVLLLPVSVVMFEVSEPFLLTQVQFPAPATAPCTYMYIYL